MSEDSDDESLAASIYKEKRGRYYAEGFLITTTIGLALLVAKYGLSVQVFTNSEVGVAMYGGGLITSAVIAVRITRGLPGLGLGSAFENALFAAILSAISIVILGVLFLIPTSIIGLPLSIVLSLLLSVAWVTDLILSLTFAFAFGAAAVFTAAAVSTELDEKAEKQLTSAIAERASHQRDLSSQVERQPSAEDSSDGSDDKSGVNTTTSEANKPETAKHLETAASYLEKSESRISDSDFEMAKTQLSRAEKYLTRTENNESNLPDQYDQLRHRAESLQSLIEQHATNTSYLDTAEDCLDSASSYLESGDPDMAKKQVATAKGRLTRVEGTIEETNLPRPERYESLRSRCDSLETSIKEAQVSKPLEQASECLDTCASAIEANDLDRARKQLHEAKTHLDELEQIASQTPNRYEQLRARHESLQTSISGLETIASDLDTATECLENAASHLADDELAAASTQLTTANERLTQVEASREDLDVSLPQRYEDLSARYDSLQDSSDSLESAHSMFETAAECLDTATTQLDQQEFEAAKKQLSTAKGRLTRAKNTLDEAGVTLPDRHETLQARCDSIADTIETEQQAEHAVTTAVDALNSGYEAYEDGNLTRAASNFDTVTEQLATVRDSSVDAQTLSPDMSLEAIAAETARGQIRLEMQRAEQLVADGHEALDDRNYAGAVEAYEDALSKLRSASGIASEHELPQSWELDHRQETIASYLANAKDQRDATDEQRSETARHRLDRATRLAETAEQHLEVDDAVAAREDIQQAQDVLDDAAELVAEIAGDTTDFEHRISECTERIERIAVTVPDQNQMQTGPGNASKRDLLTYLQELSVIFGESPRAEFVDEYGFYPSSAYLEVFDSWEAALDEANLAPIDERARERRVYSRVDILDAIIDLADETGGNPTPEQMNEHGTVSTATVEKRFESWATAVQLAGLDRQLTQDVVRELASGVTATTSMAEDADSSNSETIETHSDSSQTASTGEKTDDSPSRADLIAALQQMDPDRGYPLTTTMREDGPYNPEQYYTEFGSWDDSLAAADIDKQNRLLAEIQRVADIVGHPPSTTEMNEHSVHSSGTYSSAFPGWEAALQEADLPADVTETATDDGDSTDTVEQTPDHLDGVVTLASVTDNSRLDRPIVVKLTRESARTGEKKDANFQVEDLEGATAWFNVWSTHDIDVAWEVGQWYVLENARGKAWTSDGQQKQALSSTKDLAVTNLGTTRPTANIRTDATTAETTTAAATGDTGDHTAVSGDDTTAASQTKEASETAENGSDSVVDDDNDDILDEVMGEFEDL